MQMPEMKLNPPTRGKDQKGSFYSFQTEGAKKHYYQPKDVSSRAQAMNKAVKEHNKIQKASASTSIQVPVKPIKAKSLH